MISSIAASDAPSDADRAANSFVVVEAEGAHAAGDGAIHFANVTSSVPVSVKARSGWLVNGRKELEFVRSPGETGTLTVTSVFGEDEAHVPYEDCTFASTVTNRHVAPPGIVIDAGTSSRLFMYALPATNVQVSASAVCHVSSNGLHEAVTTWLPCPVCGAERKPSETAENVVMPPGSIHWVPPSQNGSSTGWSWTGFLSKGVGQTVPAAVVASNGCDECVCGASTNFVFDVYELSIARNDFLGLDRTDAGRSNAVIKTAVAHIDPGLTSDQIGYSWTECGICSFTSRTDEAFADYFASDPDVASASYLAEPLTVTATVTEDGRSVSASCTTNFTVVAVDVTIGDVDESDEETVGAFVQYTPDTNGAITADGTNKMVAVSFSCEPDNLPPAEMVTISCSGPGELYEVLLNGILARVTSASYRADEIASRSFKLHGHGVSSLVRDGMIEIIHPNGNARDVAKYTDFGIDFMVLATAPMNADAKRTVIGVGEKVLITTFPSAKTVASNNGKITEIGAGASKYEAPDFMCTDIVFAEFECGESCSVVFDVMSPTGYSVSGYEADNYSVGVAGAGMRVDLQMLPLDVYLGNVEFKEIGGPATNRVGILSSHSFQQVLCTNRRIG